MSGDNRNDWFGGRGRGRGGRQNWAGDAIWDTMEQVRGSFEQRMSPRMGRGDVRAAVLALLVEGPMHGYQIIHEIEARSGGSWKPSPGSVYPTLQLLADEGLITAEAEGGRKTYSLTAEGREVADAAAARPAPWEASGMRSDSRTGALPRAGVELAQAVAQVGRTGSTEQVDQAVAILEDARRKMFLLLAQD